MVVEEPSVVAAASNAAQDGPRGRRLQRRGRRAGDDRAGPARRRARRRRRACDRVRRHQGELFALGDAAGAEPGAPRRRHARPRAARPRRRHDRRAPARRLPRRDGREPGQHRGRGRGRRASPSCAAARIGLRILSNLCDQRRVRVRCRVPADVLAGNGFSGAEVRDGIVRASRFAELDPYRAATHNKGMMNGIDAVVIATGNDWRAVEAGAHAYAARNGRYEPLCVWRKDGRGPRRRARAAAGARHGRRPVARARRRAPGPARSSSVSSRDRAGDGRGVRRAWPATSPRCARSRPRASSAATWRCTRARSRSRPAPSARDVERVASKIHHLGQVNLEAAHKALAD